MKGTSLALAFFLIFKFCLAAKENGLVVHFRQFAQCPDVKDPTMKFERLDLFYLGNDTYQMEGEIRSSGVVDGHLKYTLEIEKCSVDGNSDKCKHYLKYIVDDLCKDLKRSGSLARMYLENSGIPPKCPILPGNYTIKPQKVGIDDMAKNVALKKLNSASFAREKYLNKIKEHASATLAKLKLHMRNKMLNSVDLIFTEKHFYSFLKSPVINDYFNDPRCDIFS